MALSAIMLALLGCPLAARADDSVWDSLRAGGRAIVDHLRERARPRATRQDDEEGRPAFGDERGAERKDFSRVTAEWSPPESDGPTFARIVIGPGGTTRFEGRGLPRSRVVLETADGEVGSTSVAGDGRWSIQLARPLAHGVHRIEASVRSARTGKPTLGADVRLAIPKRLAGEVVVDYGGASETADPSRGRAEAIAHDAGEAFDNIVGHGADRGSSTVRDARGRLETTGQGAPQSSDPVVRWLERSARDYQESVVRALSVPRGPANAPDGAPESSVAGGPRSQDRGGWIERARREYQEVVAPRLSVPGSAAPSTETARDAHPPQPPRQEAAKTPAPPAASSTRPPSAPANTAAAREEARRAEEATAQERAAQARAAEERRLEEQRRTEEARRTAETLQREADAKRAAEEAQRAAEARRAEELARQEEEARRLAEAAARKAEAERRAAERDEAQRQAEKSRADAIRLDEARRKQEAEARRIAGEREREDVERRRAAEERAKAEASAAERRKSLDEKSAADAGRKEEAKKLAQEEAERRKADRLRRAAEAREAAAKRKAEAARLAAATPRPSPEDAVKARRPRDQRPAEGSAEGDDENVGIAGRGVTGDAAESCPPVRARPLHGMVAHVVRPGDTLWGLARLHYGDGRRYPIIYRANRGRIRDPHRIIDCRTIYLPKRGSMR